MTENEPTPDAPGLQQFRKKPVVIEAVQFTREMAEGSVPLPIGVAMGSRSLGPDGRFPEHANDGVYLTNYSTQHRHFIVTLEGTMDVQIGDWIITGVKGEHYPCKPDIFAATYEPADTPTARPLPSDWVAVPQHATEEMIDAGEASPDERPAYVYAAMLKAAPSAPAEGGESRPTPQNCTHKFGFDPRVCLRCGWDFRKNGDPPDVGTAPEPMAQGDAIYQFRDAYGAWRDTTKSHYDIETSLDKRTLYASPQPAANPPQPNASVAELFALADNIDREARECPTVDWRPNAHENARNLRNIARALTTAAGGGGEVGS